MTQFTITELDRIDGAINVHPQISGEKVVWSSTKKKKNKILFYDGKKIDEIVSYNMYRASFPKISNNNVVWTARDSNGEEQILLYNSENTIQLSDSEHNKTVLSYEKRILSFQISDSNVVWCSKLGIFGHIPWEKYVDPLINRGNYGSIFFHNGKEAVLVNKNKLGSSPQISENQVVWQEIISLDDEDSEIFLYDGKETIQLTDNNVYDFSPQISGNNIVWVSGRTEKNLLLDNGKEVIQLNDSGVRSSSPQIDGENVVWRGISTEGDGEIFFYNGKETIQLTDNDINDISPQISGKNIVWVGEGTGNEVFVYNGSEIIQLTNNKELVRIDPRIEGNPKIDGNRVVWQRINLADSTTSVMMATIDRPQSSYIQPVDRPTQIINTSAIAIFGLIFVYLLKKLIANN